MNRRQQINFILQYPTQQVFKLTKTKKTSDCRSIIVDNNETHSILFSTNKKIPQSTLMLPLQPLAMIPQGVGCIIV
jgi:hypothetical protein